MDITADEFKLLTGTDFADHFPDSTSDEVERGFGLYRRIATSRLLVLLGNKKQSEVEAIAEKNQRTDLLKLLLARMVEVLILEQQDFETHGFSQKVVEDFRITFDKRSSPALTEFIASHTDLLRQFADASAVRFPKRNVPRGFIV